MIFDSYFRLYVLRNQHCAGDDQQQEHQLPDSPVVYFFADRNAGKEADEHERHDLDRRDQRGLIQNPERRIEREAEHVFRQKHDADVRLERAVCLRDAADVGRQQRAHTEQAAEHARGDADQRRQPFFLFSRLALPAQHIQRDEDDGCAEDDFDDAPVDAAEHQRAGDVARQHQRHQRPKDLRIEALSVLPRQNGVVRKAERQLDRGNARVVDAEAQNALKHQRVGETAEPLDEKRRKGREDEKRHGLKSLR